MTRAARMRAGLPPEFVLHPVKPVPANAARDRMRSHNARTRRTTSATTATTTMDTPQTTPRTASACAQPLEHRDEER